MRHARARCACADADRTAAQASTQTASYSRRIIGRLVREADDRDEPLHAISVLSVACVGSHLRLLRTRSGAPADGNFAGAQPCPSEWTPALPLLAEWDPRAPGASCPPAAPPAFSALLRLLLAPPSVLNPLTAPQTAVELECGPLRGEVKLEERLGCGGTCDAYRVVAAAASGPLVLKLPRCATETVARGAKDEANALRALADAGASDAAVPRLVAEGVRVLRSRPAGAHPSTLSWPALLLSPAGTPLAPALGAALAAASSSLSRRAARRRLADLVVAGILRGLHATHAAGRVHCDVRPKNVVIVPAAAAGGEGSAMLVDYGLCRAAREPWPRLGDRSFAATRAYTPGGCPAAAGLDLFSAALTWLALARGGSGSASAPWGSRGEKVDLWLQAQANADADAEAASALRSLLWHLRFLSAADATPAPAHYYEWPWPPAELRASRRGAAPAAALVGLGAQLAAALDTAGGD